ncbi:MAG: ABC transporter permease [Providencia sp.]|uniref:ABC transporter permease n=1 Tax=Providencia sp. TaxID=589 RepID=UPI003F9D3DAB
MGILLNVIILSLALIVVLYTFLVKYTDTKYLFLIFKNNFRINVFVLIIIIFFYVFSFLCGGFLNHLIIQLEEHTARTNIGHIQIYQKGYLDSSRNESMKYLIEKPLEIITLLNENDDLNGLISNIAEQLVFSGSIHNEEKNTSTYFRAIAIEPFESIKFGAYDLTISGSDLSKVNHQEITLDSKLASSVGLSYSSKAELRIIDSLGRETKTNTRVRGIFQAGAKSSDFGILKIPIETARKILKTSSASTVSLFLNDAKKTEQTLAIINNLIEQHHFELEVLPWYELSDHVSETIKFFSVIFLFIKVLTLIISFSLIGLILMINTESRHDDINVLASIGANQFYLARMVIFEGIFLALIISFLSFIINYSIYYLININGLSIPLEKTGGNSYQAYIVWDKWSDLVLILVIFPIISTIAALIYPVYKMLCVRVNFR